MVATHDREQTTRIGKFALLDILHPSSINPDRNLMFTLTSNRTGVTSDTASVVNNESVIGHAGIFFQQMGNWRGSKQVAY